MKIYIYMLSYFIMLNMSFRIIIEFFGFLKQNEKQINKNKKEFCLFVKLIKIKLDVYRDKINNIWIIDLF